MDIYKKAAMQRLRFTTSKGELSVEQLFQLSEDEIESLGAQNETQLKELSKGEGFFSSLRNDSKEAREHRLKKEIIEDVYLEFQEQKEEAKTKNKLRRKLEEKEQTLQKVVRREESKKDPEVLQREIEEIKAQLV